MSEIDITSEEWKERMRDYINRHKGREFLMNERTRGLLVEALDGVRVRIEPRATDGFVGTVRDA